jgi:Fe-S-cluster formation regulator IscX/YfhJ
MCPKPYITAESQSLLEEFFVWRRLRVLDGEDLSARQVEAFMILEKELAAEIRAGRCRTTRCERISFEMATFPQLKTGAVAQYPATKSLRFQNQTVRFLDGSEQRYRDAAGALHQWVIQLSELDESEMAAFEQFFEDNQGVWGALRSRTRGTEHSTRIAAWPAMI